ncbi:MAG TPA: OsmC family protein [Candidatus Aquilonibacter sp.]|nr:OsmC family protein [Candidatus Aquilonibacter sp.]
MAAEHIYRVSAWWTSGKTGLAKCESAPTAIHFSEPAELGGLEGRWSPEQLFLCALAGCFTTTFEVVARGAKFAYTDLEVEVEGAVHKNKGCTFDEIVLRPTLTVSSDEELDEGLALLRRAKSLCMISRAISVAQTMEPKVEVCRPPAGGWVAETEMKLGV